jgi:zinc protease
VKGYLLLAAGLLACPLFGQMRVAALPSKSPLVTFRIVFTAGSILDPPDKPGVANLTAAMLAQGGTREMTYQQIVDAMYPMASRVSARVDNEMTVFIGETHIDNLDAYYKLFRAMLLDPGWREDDFKRIQDNTINYLRTTLRGSNDEELGKEVLYNTIYAGTPYGHYSAGTVSSIEKMTLDDVKAFYKAQYAQANLIVGLAGGYPPAFLETVKKDFRALPAGAGFRPRMKNPAILNANKLVLIDKDTRSVAYSLGFPISVKRGDPDYPALLIAASYFGQHRSSGGRLYDRMREARGLNYGDYAYIEYFPRGMFLFEPEPNIARKQQIFQIWIRPVEPPTAKFALRLAIYELDKLLKEGIPQEGFDRTREFLGKYVNILTKTKSAELGYRIDSMYYGMPDYNRYLKMALAKVTRDDVNRVIKRYLRNHLVIVGVAKNAAELKAQLLSDDPSPMTYNSAKPADITEEDKVVEKFPLNLSAENATVIPVSQVFE